MVPNNNLSVLPWYTSIEQQNARKWWVYNRIYPLFTPANMLLPFQIMRRHKVLGALDERIQAEYIYRQSDPRLGNGPIQITKIFGNTLVWNQLFDGDERTVTRIGVPITIQDGHCTGSGTADSISTVTLLTSRRTELVIGHKYYIHYSGSHTGCKLSFYAGASYPMEDLTESMIITADGTNDFNYIIKGESVGASVVFDCHLYFVDLTLMFGEGNEPSTVAEFEAFYPNAYYDYNLGQLINNVASGIETKDADNNVTNYLQLNLNSFQVKDAQGVISTINGLKKAGSVYDEIMGNHYTQRIGVSSYESGDENNPSYITDGTNTYYPLDTPIEYEIISNYPGNYPIYNGYLNGTEEVKYIGITLVAPIRYEATPYRLLNMFKIFKADGAELADYTEQMNRMLAVKTIDDVDVLVYAANIPFTPSFPNGQYYAVMSDGLNVWYSEVFTAVNDIQPYLKIEWWDTEDFVMDAGVIVYREPNFKNILYLDSDLAKPEYPFEEEGETRDGYFFPVKQISEKHYRFKFFASEYLLDVMRFIRMADYARIIYRGQTYSLDTFLITPEWEDNGDVASVEAEFDTATVAKKIGRGYIVPTGGDFNDDFNNDFNNQE